MSIEGALKQLENKGKKEKVIYFHNSDITVSSTAEALDVDEDRICKGLAIKGKGNAGIILLASGHAHLDNGKFKSVMGFRPSMIHADRVEELVGQVPGTINPFDIRDDVQLYLDLSIRKHLGDTVFPGIGGKDSVVELTVQELEDITDFVCWVDVCR